MALPSEAISVVGPLGRSRTKKPRLSAAFEVFRIPLGGSGLCNGARKGLDKCGENHYAMRVAQLSTSAVTRILTHSFHVGSVEMLFWTVRRYPFRMDQTPIASAQNDSITPFAWEIDVVDQSTNLKLSVWDLSHPESPRIVAEVETSVQRDELLDINDDAPDELARSILDSLIAGLRNFHPDDERRDALWEKVTDWIISSRESVVEAHDI